VLLSSAGRAVPAIAGGRERLYRVRYRRRHTISVAARLVQNRPHTRRSCAPGVPSHSPFCRAPLTSHPFPLHWTLQQIRNTLQQARENHKSAVQERIDSVGDLNDVVSLTKALFALSKVRAVVIASPPLPSSAVLLRAVSLDEWGADGLARGGGRPPVNKKEVGLCGIAITFRAPVGWQLRSYTDPLGIALCRRSQETATLEAENFTLRQQTALSAEAKAVLDSWVRHEQTVRESEQADLVKTVQSNVLKALADQKVKKDLVASAVADLENLVKTKAI
jgi:hypothetical protein